MNEYAGTADATGVRLALVDSVTSLTPVLTVTAPVGGDAVAIVTAWHASSAGRGDAFDSIFSWLSAPEAFDATL